MIDQSRGDASVGTSGADAGTFREMLAMAQIDTPGALAAHAWLWR